MRVVDGLAINPSELQTGDTILFVAKLVVMKDAVGRNRFRIYRCPCSEVQPGIVQPEDIPQGSRILPQYESAVAECFFPVTLWAGIKPDTL